MPEDHLIRRSNRFPAEDVTAIRCPVDACEVYKNADTACWPEVGTVTYWDRKLPADVEAVSRHAPVPFFGSGFPEDRVSPPLIVQFAVPKFAESLRAFVRASSKSKTGTFRGPREELVEIQSIR